MTLSDVQTCRNSQTRRHTGRAKTTRCGRMILTAFFFILVVISFSQPDASAQYITYVTSFQFDNARGFADNGLAPVEKNGKWGFINEKGQTVIDFQFDDARSFADNGLAVVKKKRKIRLYQ